MRSLPPLNPPPSDDTASFTEPAVPAGTPPAAAHYRREASRLASLAAASPYTDTKAQFLELAQQFAALAHHIELATRRSA
jgi:hypothetical protein